MAVIVVSEGLSDPLDPPGSFATGTPSSSSVPLSWTYTDDNQTGFEIQRSLNDSDWTTIVTTSSSARSYTATGLDELTLYYFRIRAVDSVETGRNSSFTSSVSETTAEAADWQLAEGHWVPRKFDMTIAHPRPNAELAVYELCKNAYTGVAWSCPIYVYGGAWPFRFELVSGPTGMTIGETLEASGDVLVPGSDYGILNWSNPTAGSHSITVRVYDQDYGRGGDPSSYAEVTWTLVVGTSNWVFIDPVSGDDGTGDGTIGNPFQTTLALHSDSITTDTYNGKCIYLRAGTHVLEGLSGSSGNYVAQAGDLPCSFIGYPGESVTVSQDSGWFRFLVSGWGVKDLTITHAGAWGSSQKMIVAQTDAARGLISNVTFDDFLLGTSASSNGAAIFLDHAGANDGEYMCVGHCTFTGTQGSGIHTYGMRSCVFEANVWQNCTFSQFEASGYGAIGLKDDTNGLSVRRNENWDSNNWGGLNANCPIYTMGQNGGIQNVEICWNTFNKAVGSRGGAIHYGRSTGNAHINVFEYRNSLENGVVHELNTSTKTNFHIENNILDTGSYPATTGITFTDNQDGGSFLDANMALTGSARTSYLGTHGAEVA